MRKIHRPVLVSLVLLTFTGLLAPPWVAPSAAKVQTAALDAHQQLLFDIYKELVETNTTDSVGNTTEAAEKMAARLRAAGFAAEDVQVLVQPGHARKGNVVARLRGTGAGRPVLLLAHLDVVEAKREDWSPDLDPF